MFFKYLAIFPLLLPLSTLASAESACLSNQQEALLAKRLLSKPEQQRDTLRCNGRLQRLARQWAEEIASRQDLLNITKSVPEPNRRLREAGYELPLFYRDTHNNVLTLGAGQSDPELMWYEFLKNERSRTHLLGQDEELRRQTEFGIGYVQQKLGRFGDIWVIIIARPPLPGEDDMYCGETGCGDLFKPVKHDPSFRIRFKKSDEQLAKEKLEKRARDGGGRIGTTKHGTRNGPG